MVTNADQRHRSAISLHRKYCRKRHLHSCQSQCINCCTSHEKGAILVDPVPSQITTLRRGFRNPPLVYFGYWFLHSIRVSYCTPSLWQETWGILLLCRGCPVLQELRGEGCLACHHTYCYVLSELMMVD